MSRAITPAQWNRIVTSEITTLNVLHLVISVEPVDASGVTPVYLPKVAAERPTEISSSILLDECKSAQYKICGK